MHARVAPKAAAKRWTSLHEGGDVQEANRKKASAAQMLPATIAIQNGCTGCGTNCCPMTVNHAAPITNATSPPSHAGTVLRSLFLYRSGEGRPKLRTRYASAINATIKIMPSATIIAGG